MATVWVDPLNGNDADDGSTFALGKATLSGAVAVANVGDTINVANTAALVMSGLVNLASDFNGTDFSSFGLRIRGTDSAGNDDMTELRFTDDAAAQTMIELDVTGAPDPAYVIIEGFHVNWAANATTSATKIFVGREGVTAGPVWIKQCRFTYSELVRGAIFSDTTAGVADGGLSCEISHNYIEDAGSTGGSAFLVNLHHRSSVASFHHNVIYVTGNYAHRASVISMGSNDGDTTDHRVYNNTWYNTVNQSQILWSSNDTASTGGNATKHLHSNVVFTVQTSAAYQYAAGAAAGLQATYDKVMGFSLFNITGAPTLSTGGYYQRPWDPDDDDTGAPEALDRYATDVLVSAGTVFHDSGTPFLWDFEGSDRSVTIFGDIRITDANGWRTMSQSAGVPGALAEAPVIIDLVVTKSHVGNFQVGEVGSFTLEVENVGNGTATSTITLVDVLPAGLTYRAASGVGWVVVVQNSHTITATWDGDVGPGDSTVPLVIEVDVAETARPSVDNTVDLDSADDDDDSTDTDTVAVDPAVDVPPGNPSLLISENAPGFPVFTASLRVRRNLWLDARAEAIGEDSSGLGRLFSAIVELPAGATNLELPMILQPTFLMLETDQDLVVQLNSQTFPLLAGGCAAMTEAAQINTFAVTNQSAFKVANLQYCGAAAVTQGTVPDPDGGRGDDEDLN